MLCKQTEIEAAMGYGLNALPERWSGQKDGWVFAHKWITKFRQEVCVHILIAFLYKVAHCCFLVES